MDIHKKSNKENTRPKLGQQKAVTSFIKRAVPGKTTAPLQSKNDQKDRAVETRAEPVKKPEQKVIKSFVSKPTAEAKKTQTLSQTFLSQQSANYKKLLIQGPKPVASAAPPKILPGTYKGKVIQSKVDCFRKPGESVTIAATDRKVFAKPAVPKTVGPPPASLSRVKSKSVATLAAAVKTAAPLISQPRRPKSVTDVPLSRPASKTNRGGQTQTVSTTRQFQITNRPAATARSVPPTTSSRPVSRPKAPTVTARPAPATAKKSNEQMSKNQNGTKPPVAGTSQRTARKPVTSTLSHTRVGMETVEERRAKLAEWLAAKGKTLKRPPIHSTQPAQRSRPLVKPKADTQQQSQEEAQLAAAEPESLVPEALIAEPVPEPEPEAVAELEPVDEGSVTSSPAKVMNTTLDMVDNCELDLPEVDVRLENLVVNLCEALEAMETPSACQSSEPNMDEGHQREEQETIKMEEREEEEEEIKDEQDEIEIAKDEIKEEFADKMMESEASPKDSDDSGEDSEVEGMEADSIEESASGSDSGEEGPVESAAAVAESEVKTEVKTEVKAEDDDDDDDDDESEDEDVEVVDNCGPKTPECSGASVVKFSVRTTPYLQSMKKRIDSESAVAPSSCGSTRRQRQSGAAAIGDLKFLTPVRRSRRIERQSARLPAALTEHDPCVTSLAELARLEGGSDGDDEVHVGAAMAANAYIYRRNPALLDELPDGHGDLTRL